MPISHSTVVVVADDGTSPVGSDEWNAAHSVDSINVVGGTITTNKPILEGSQTWNAGGVTFQALKLNVTDTASAAASLLMDVQKGGSSQFTIAKNGQVLINSLSTGTSDQFVITGGPADGFTNLWLQGSGRTYQIGLGNAGETGFGVADKFFIYDRNGARMKLVLDGAASVIRMPSDMALGWFNDNGGFGGATVFDTKLYRDAAATLAQRDGTNAQTFRVYDSFTDASNYARFSVSGKQIKTEKAGTGSDTVTTNTPILDLSQTWNAAVSFTALKLNVTITASDGFGKLLDLQVNGLTKLQVFQSGATTVLGTSGNADSLAFAITGDTWARTTLGCDSSNVAHFALGDGTVSPETRIYRDAAHIVAQRNGTNAQALRVYNTFTDASNYERGIFDWSSVSNILTIGTQAAGTGTARGMRFSAANGGYTFVSPGASVTPTNNGDLMIQATSNTSLTFKYKGTDGTVRSGSLTLA
jgi:hypothetical protein